jgi:hypothetical protein
MRPAPLQSQAERPYPDATIVPLIFFFSGTKFPRYGRDSLRIARRSWPGPVVLLTDTDLKRVPRGVTVERYESWFSSTGFDSFCEKSPLNGNFRGGFWHKTVLRFFVLEQFMERTGVSRFLHLELDVAPFDLSGVTGALDDWGSGFFVPWLTPEHGIASLAYCNSAKALKTVLNGFATHVHVGHEMAMLGRILKSSPREVFGLPCSGTLAKQLRGEALPSNQIPVSEELGIFDAAPFGHWLLGNDARNQRGSWVKNHFLYHYTPDSRTDLERLAPKFFVTQNKIWLESNGLRLRVRCLHIHSKAMYLVRSRLLLRIHVNIANKPKTSLVMVLPRLVLWGDSRQRELLSLLLVRAKRLVFLPRKVWNNLRS